MSTVKKDIVKRIKDNKKQLPISIGMQQDIRRQQSGKVNIFCKMTTNHNNLKPSALIINELGK